MKRVFVVLFAMLLVGVVAGPAYAGTDPGTGGYIEVCKAANPLLTGQFQFTITDSVGHTHVYVAQGTCTNPIPVKDGTVTVSEVGSSAGMNDAGVQGTIAAPIWTREFLKDPTVTAYGKDGVVTVGAGADAFTKTVPVPAGTSASVVTITFANALDPGVVEVCKNVTDPALTGTWSFTVTGGNGFSQATTTTVGNCSAPITLPAGHFKVVEDGIQSVSSITGTQVTGTVNAVVGPLAGKLPDLPNATVVATAVRGDASKQTIVTYTNSLVRLKLCKVWDSSATAPATFPFTFVATGNAGPAGPIAPLSLAPGTMLNPNCVVVGTYRAGTRVAITEGITPGTKVSNITANQGIVPDTLSKPNRTVTVDLMAGETVVTYTDKPADPGWLKICKATTLDSPVIPAGTVFSFTLTAVTGYPAGTTATVTVAAGAPGTTMCSAPVPSKFDATWTVTEAARPNTTVTAIAAVPDWVMVDGVNTNQPVLTAVNLAARSANVTIGESNTTELTFTNKDPVEVATGGSSSGSSAGSSSSSSAAAVVATGSQAVVSAPAKADTATAAASKAATLKAQKVAQLKKQLATLKATQAKLQKAFLSAKTKAAKNSLAKRIAVVKASQKKINLQLKQLK